MEIIEMLILDVVLIFTMISNIITCKDYKMQENYISAYAIVENITESKDEDDDIIYNCTYICEIDGEIHKLTKTYNKESDIKNEVAVRINQENPDDFFIEISYFEFFVAKLIIFAISVFFLLQIFLIIVS